MDVRINVILEFIVLDRLSKKQFEIFRVLVIYNDTRN